MKRTKKVLCLTLALTMISSILTGCGKADPLPEKTPLRKQLPEKLCIKSHRLGL